jgi:hypothetical protein
MFLLVVAALRAESAMVRVVAIEDGRTITVDRNGTRERIRLAGVEVTNDASARELLRWTAGEAWVMLEPAGGGEFLVYRSPDALLLNRELVLRGFARATLPATAPELRAPSRYLGTIDPPSTPQTTRQAKPPAKVSEGRRQRTDSGTSRRSSAPRSRRARSPGR